MEPSRKLINWFDRHHHFRANRPKRVGPENLSSTKMAGFGSNCIETQEVCTLEQDKNPILACGAESLHSKRQHIFCTAHAAGDKHISSSAVPPTPFTPYLTESTGHKVMLYKGKYQVMLLQV